MRLRPPYFKPLTLSLSGLMLAACATAPPAPERKDALEPPTEFSFAEDGLTTVAPVTVEWWKTFDDPALTSLIETALSHNKDLDVAAANIETTRAILGTQVLRESVSTLSNGSAEFGRPAREGADLEVTGTGSLGASWEYDAFGRIASQIESSEFDIVVAKELRRDVAVIVAAETALAYVDLRGNQVRLSVAQTNAALQQDSLDLLQTLFDNGRATRLDLERAQSQYRTTLATLPLLEANVRTAAARLVTLTGRSGLGEAPEIEALLEVPGETPLPPQTLAVASPEDLIRRRPDIRAVEAEIASLLALGEVERARLFPTLTLNANLLTLFSDDNDLADSFGVGIGPAIRWDGPDLRRVRADIDVADARTRVAFARYEQSVINALGEVEVALINYSQEQARQADLEAASASAEQAVSLARLRFEEGVDDFLDVIDAQRTLLDAQDRLESSRLDTTRQAIAAYRALGGIWTSDALDDASRSGD